MAVVGVTADLPVRSLTDAGPFYRLAFGREEDLAPRPGTLEWVLYDDPQIAIRVVEDPARAGSARVGVGVDDIGREHERLSRVLDAVPDVEVVPNVIALVELVDDDGNRLVFWQDLLGPRS